MNGEILIVGGATAGYPKVNEAMKPHLLSRSDVFSFNAVTKMWELVATMPEARANCGATCIGMLILSPRKTPQFVLPFIVPPRG